MNKLYSAKSLEQIASLFDRNFRMPIKNAEKAKTKRQREIYAMQSIIWNQASDILKQAQLVP